jgi:Neurotransmitter-gated ion-channel transmembrane region.
MQKRPPKRRQWRDVCFVIAGGNYSALTVRFDLAREVGHYIMDYFVPSILLVVVSWVTFWLDPNAVPGRTTLGKLRGYADDQLLARRSAVCSHLKESVPPNHHIQVTAAILGIIFDPEVTQLKPDLHWLLF